MAVVVVVVVRLACATAADGRSLKCCTVDEALDTEDKELVLLWARRRPALGLLLLEMLSSEAEIQNKKILIESVKNGHLSNHHV